MERKYDTEKTARGHKNGHMFKANESLQENMPEGIRNIDKYDIRKLRSGQKKLQRWVAQSDPPPEITNGETATQAWGKLKNQIRHAIKTNCALGTKEKLTTKLDITNKKWGN